MNAPVILDRRRLLAGSGALIVSFSLSGAFAQDQGQNAPAAAPAPKPPACPFSALKLFQIGPTKRFGSISTACEPRKGVWHVGKLDYTLQRIRN